MIARLIGLAIALCLAAPATARDLPADPARQILVMLRLAAPHFRAGTGYGGGYGEDQSRGGRKRIATAIARRHGLALGESWPMPAIGVDCFIMTVPEGRPTEQLAEDVARYRAVAWAQPVSLYRAQAADPLFEAQPAAKAWHLAALHRVATGRRVKVAVVDSQVELKHPDLAGQIAVARDFVTGRPAAAEDHGTGIAGVIAARLANGIGSAGVAPDARIYALRACWQQPQAPTVCDTLSLAKAIAFAVEARADIINLSLSGPPDRLLASLLRTGMARGAEIVAAYDPKLAGGGFPATLDGVIAVAAAPVDGDRGPYWAPGRDIPTTQPGGRWYLVSGSSFAAAEVSGLLALLRERRARPVGADDLVSARVAGGEIDGCATLLGRSPACGRADSASAAGAHERR